MGWCRSCCGGGSCRFVVRVRERVTQVMVILVGIFMKVR